MVFQNNDEDDDLINNRQILISTLNSFPGSHQDHKNYYGIKIKIIFM